MTNGPYKYTKHPDYIAKCVFFWLIHVPFLSDLGAFEIVRNCVLLVILNLIYFARARIEERHLSDDPVYVAYALEINRTGVFRVFRRLIPALHYASVR